jgi:hypothetical protein
MFLVLFCTDIRSQRSKHCIARTSDGRDVLIRLISKGSDGLEELDVLEYVATGHRAFLGDNHCLPMLRTLVVEDMRLGVFPFVNPGFSWPWYHNVDEVFDAVLQVLQVRQDQYASHGLS